MTDGDMNLQKSNLKNIFRNLPVNSVILRLTGNYNQSDAETVNETMIILKKII